MRRVGLRRLIGLLAVTALVGACGARLDREQQAALEAAARGPAPLGGVALDSTATTVGSADQATTNPTGSGATAAGRTGTGPDAGGPPVDDCRPEPSEEVGVTDTEIILGNVSMITGPIPGAGQTGVDGTRAYLAYVNHHGGVCGRTLRLVTGDDRTDTGQNRSEAKRLMGQALGLVGGATIVDGGTAEALQGTNVPAVQVAVADNALRSPNVFSPSPLDPEGTTNGSIGHWRYFARARGLTKLGIVVVALPSARARATTYVNDLRAAGIELAGIHEVGLAETNYVAVAQQLANAGADGFLALLDPVGASRLGQAAAQIGWKPKVAHYGVQNYGRPLIELGRDAVEGAVVSMAFDIFEAADTNPAVARFTEWFARTAPSRTPDFYAAMGWASADLMVDALRAAGPAPTRDAVLAHLRTVTSYDADGFLAPCNPAGKVTSPLFMVAEVRNGEWRRVYPDRGFADGS